MSDTTFETIAAFRHAAREEGFFARLAGIVARHRARRTTSRALRELDGHMLSDIGLTRGDLDRMLQSSWTV
jgi:uncharacterized protein YjiS (DUF1127 family)